MDKEISMVLVARRLLLPFGKEKETFAPNVAFSTACKKNASELFSESWLIGVFEVLSSGSDHKYPEDLHLSE